MKKESRSNKPEAFKQRVRVMSAQGYSKAKIARTTHVTKSCVDKILNEPEARATLEQTKLRLLDASREALDVYIRRMKEKDDDVLASRILVATGVLPKEVVPELKDPPFTLNNNQQLQLMQLSMGKKTEGAIERKADDPEGSTGMVMDLLRQIAGTAKRHEIDVSPKEKTELKMTEEVMK